MHRASGITAILILSFLGLADAWYLAESALDGAELSCSIGAGLDGCNIVEQSAYAHLFGVPLGLYGVVFYAAVFTLAAVITLFHVRTLYRALFYLSLLGALASLVFLFLQLFVIEAICIYCTASVLAALLICALAYWLLRRIAPPKLAVVL